MTHERIKELSRREAEWRSMECHNIADILQECLDAIELLQKRNLELEKDRERLEWLHEKQHSDCFQTDKHDWVICHYIGNHKHKEFRAPTWRQAIDAAIKGDSTSPPSSLPSPDDSSTAP
jgi:predicted RNase H-like nuclease